jgi:putative colanic acid biosynthesis UDP-glucose lipid carrier transferase
MQFGLTPSKIEVLQYGHLPAFSFRKEPLEQLINRFVKRTFDVVFSSLVILLVFTWLFSIIGIIIKLSSKGPVFFRQLRSGENNHTFYCYKFRTMRVNGYADQLQATKKDPRITKIGSFLRRTSLDELPQFINVFLGSMSVVGPRPHMISHTEEYSTHIDDFMVRHYLKPGITGWAQVNGYRGETKEIEDMANRVKCDIWYLENWNFLLDFKIVYLTVYNTINGDPNAF